MLSRLSDALRARASAALNTTSAVCAGAAFKLSQPPLVERQAKELERLRELVAELRETAKGSRALHDAMASDLTRQREEILDLEAQLEKLRTEHRSLMERHAAARVLAHACADGPMSDPAVALAGQIMDALAPDCVAESAVA